MAKILLADDSTHAQRMGAKILTAEGHQVVTVGNGQSAVRSVEASIPDLVIADIFMPGRNGYELCQFVKNDPRLKTVPVLLIIGAMEPYDAEEAKRCGADRLITKPLESSNLVQTVQELLAASPRFVQAAALQAQQAAAAEAEKPKAEPKAEEAGPRQHVPQHVPQQFPVEEPSEPTISSSGIARELGFFRKEAVPPPPPRSPSQESVAAGSDGAAEAQPQAAKASVVEPVGHMTPMPSPASVPSSFTSFSPPPAPGDDAVWIAEAAPVTAEEEELFARAAANWNDLTKLVEEDSPQGLELTEPALHAEPAAHLEPPPLEPAAAAPEESSTVVEQSPLGFAESLPLNANLESFDSLDAIVAAPPLEAPPAPAPPTPQAFQDPSAAEAAPPASPEPAPQAGTDSALTPAPSVEEIVRRAVEQMLPQLVERVMKSLKD